MYKKKRLKMISIILILILILSPVGTLASNKYNLNQPLEDVDFKEEEKDIINIHVESVKEEETEISKVQSKEVGKEKNSNQEVENTYFNQYKFQEIHVDNWTDVQTVINESHKEETVIDISNLPENANRTFIDIDEKHIIFKALPEKIYEDLQFTIAKNGKLTLENVNIKNDSMSCIVAKDDSELNTLEILEMLI